MDGERGDTLVKFDPAKNVFSTVLLAKMVKR